MKQLFSAITFCHTHKIVHRCIKPKNILYVPKTKTALGTVKIIDWATSRKFNTERLMHYRYGSIHYMAPEVFRGNYNEKCDIWSLGVLMYTMLSG